MTDNDRKIFDAVVTGGWYAEYVRPVGVRSKPARWELVGLDGILRGKGDDQQEALDAAWRAFQRCER